MSVDRAPGRRRDALPVVLLVLIAGTVLAIAWGLDGSVEVGLAASALALQLIEMLRSRSA